MRYGLKNLCMQSLDDYPSRSEEDLNEIVGSTIVATILVVQEICY